ncbi:hypothetical protein OAN33_05970 [Flavobacteriales bacterium]|nr:hypothetical protein [Flavobacteriales bacterium]
MSIRVFLGSILFLVLVGFNTATDEVVVKETKVEVKADTVPFVVKEFDTIKNRKGLLTGIKHFSTPTEMELLLEKEGVKVHAHQIQNFDQLFWDPNAELEL